MYRFRFAVVALVFTAACVDAVVASADVVLDWNVIALKTAAAAPFNPPLETRNVAIVHAAMLNRFFGVDAARYDVRDRLSSIRVPALVLTGRHDWICPPSQSAVLVEGLPDVRQVLFERSGHRLHREENAKFTRVVREFVLDAARDVALAAGTRRGR